MAGVTVSNASLVGESNVRVLDDEVILPKMDKLHLAPNSAFRGGPAWRAYE